MPGAPGVGVGEAVVVVPPWPAWKWCQAKQVDDIDAEIALFKQALGVRADMRALSSKLASQVRKEERALFDVYLMMLDDASIGNEVKRIIRTGQWAQGALRRVVMERAALRTDGRRLSPRAPRRRQGHGSPPARLPPGRTQAEQPAGTDHHPWRGAVAGDARRGAGEGRLVGLVSVLGSGQLARGDPRRYRWASPR
ncbi:phosphoenolpyruvate-utilizing N-terminal domain-containing protein [Pseudomonas aeruginosa]|uniref:phosphoenolpyruvate-utilizing N-terminal domain-containing protein n=1 Tax=Pseudomonas aeruginosa TaxID=287 RepID=UPI00249B9C04|nr:phosphoenolpyruvate-utilizing N-terminal domain-containing protein [Pseudomonas aeruginosa]WGW99248.1 phosphoenolpyruvate-utilizing N-terminal domain-containing protein [Pseudomonas aeruginosa]